MTSEQPPSRVRRLRTRLAIVALILAAGLTVAISADGIQPDARARAAQVSVSMLPGEAGAVVPRRFLGLSFELSSASQLAAYADHGDLTTLLRSLGQGVLRLGGASADTRTAWTDAHTPKPAWASSSLDAADLRGLRRLAARSGWKVLLTIGLAHYAPRSAAREAAAASAILGPWLAGIEVGNEPDSYGRHRLRAGGWSPARYETQVSAYRRAIAALAPGISLAGPGVSGSSAFTRWGPAEARRQDPALLTGHHYPLRCDAVPAPTVTALLSDRVRAEESASLARYMTVSLARGIPFRMDETNTVSCGGTPQVSPTFGSALWALGYIMQTVSAGVSGINFQGSPGNCLGYSPICAASPASLRAGALRAQPEWYGLLLARALVGDRPLPIHVRVNGRADLALSLLRTPEGGLHLLIAEDDPPGGAGATVRLRVGSALRRASVLRLTAPAPSATTGVLLGASAVAAEGSWPGPRRLERLAVRAGVLTVSVAPSSAVLVALSGPRGSARSW